MLRLIHPGQVLQVLHKAAIFLQPLVDFLQLDAHLGKLDLRLAHTLVARTVVHFEGIVLLHFRLQFLHGGELLVRVHLLAQLVDHGGGALDARIFEFTLVALRLSHELSLVDAVNVVLDTLEARERRCVVLQKPPAMRELLIFLFCVIIVKDQVIIKAEVRTLEVNLVRIGALPVKWTPEVFLQECVEKLVLFGDFGHLRVKYHLFIH